MRKWIGLWHVLARFAAPWQILHSWPTLCRSFIFHLILLFYPLYLPICYVVYIFFQFRRYLSPFSYSRGRVRLEKCRKRVLYGNSVSKCILCILLVFFLGSLLCIAVTTWMFDQHPTSFWPSPHFMSPAEPSCADTLQRPSFYPPIGPPCLTYYRPSGYKEFPISTQVRERPFYGS